MFGSPDPQAIEIRRRFPTSERGVHLLHEKNQTRNSQLLSDNICVNYYLVYVTIAKHIIDLHFRGFSDCRLW